MAAPARLRGGHGACRESILPSGLRKKWQSVSTISQKQVEIDYDKLRELCLETNTDNDDRELNREQRHEKFMSNYRLILRKKTSGSEEEKFSATAPNSRILSRNRDSHLDVSQRYDALETPSNWKALKTVDEHTRLKLKSILALLTKLPLLREAGEVKELSHHLFHFPSFLATSSTAQRIPGNVIVGVAGRCLLETIPNKGFSLPHRGGMYLILEGSVDQKMKDESTTEVMTTQLHEGSCFGAMEENFVTKLRYPMYVTASRCVLARITVTDYKRVLQKCEEEERRKQVELIKSCPALDGVSSAVTEVLAKDINWETLPNNTVLLNEGEIITKVGFICEGTCKAFIEVPQTIPTAMLMIGRLGPSSCVGETLLRDNSRQPYQIVTTSTVRIGWIPSTTVTMNEVSKLIPPQKDLCISVPSSYAIRQRYAHQLMAKHWTKIKSDIMREVRDSSRQQNT